MSATNISGELGVPGLDYPFGPYFTAVPVNPYDRSSKVSPVATAGARPCDACTMSQLK